MVTHTYWWGSWNWIATCEFEQGCLRAKHFVALAPHVRPFVRPLVRPSARPSACPRVRPLVRSSVGQCVYPSVRPPVDPSACSSARPSVHPLQDNVLVRALFFASHCYVRSLLPVRQCSHCRICRRARLKDLPNKVVSEVVARQTTKNTSPTTNMIKIKLQGEQPRTPFC